MEEEYSSLQRSRLFFFFFSYAGLFPSSLFIVQRPGALGFAVVSHQMLLLSRQVRQPSELFFHFFQSVFIRRYPFKAAGMRGRGEAAEEGKRLPQLPL